MQLLGIGVAIHNLLSIRISCNQVPLRIRFRDWIKAFPLRKIQSTIAKGDIKPKRSEIVARFPLLYDHEGGPSIEEKIEYLRKVTNHLREESVKREREIHSLSNELLKVKETEETAREVMRAEIREEIEHLFTQDIIGSLVGLVLVMYGVTLSSLADWIYAL